MIMGPAYQPSSHGDQMSQHAGKTLLPKMDPSNEALQTSVCLYLETVVGNHCTFLASVQMIHQMSAETRQIYYHRVILHTKSIGKYFSQSPLKVMKKMYM